MTPAKRIELAAALFGWTPHPSQREWLLDDHPVKVAACGRRWGKTEAAAVDVATFAAAFDGSVQMIVAPTYDQSKLIARTVEYLFLSNPYTRRHAQVTRTPYTEIRFRGSRIMARTADEDGRNLRGHSADRVVIDEAAFVRDEVVEEVIGPMLADRNGQLVMVSTPFGKNHFYRAFLEGSGDTETRGRGDMETQGRGDMGTRGRGDMETRGRGDMGTRRGERAVSPPRVSPPRVSPPRVSPLRVPPPRVSSFRFPSWANPHISREYIDCQRAMLTERQFKVEYEAEFVDDQASVFPWDDIEGAICDAETRGGETRGGERRDAGTVYVAGIDWARYSDYTAVVVLEVDGSYGSHGSHASHVVCVDRFNRMDWDTQVERVADLLCRYRVKGVAADQTSIGDPVLELLRRKLWEDRELDAEIEGVVFNVQTKRELIDNLAVRLAHREIVYPRIEPLVQELQFYEYEITQSGHVRTQARRGYHDDCVCALALALRIAPRYVCIGSIRSSGRKRLCLSD